ncbi:MAG: serpin family protein [Ruminococcaceae bacterium]|nr:serpin family protein [Oscillospiraceae bacterium]
MKKRIISILAAILALSMTGCSAGNNASDDGIVIGKSKHTALSPIEVTDDNVLNSIRVFDLISTDMANSMFSPLSLNMALGMLAEGAEGSSKEALAKYLGTDDYSAFAESYMKLVESKYNNKSKEDKGYNNAFKIANSFWADQGYPFKEDYKNALVEKFGAEINNVNFADKSKTLDEINSWVKEKTNKMIPSILADYRDDVVSVLINTVYFESGWVREWSLDKNDKQTFTHFSGSTKEIPLMVKNGSSYYVSYFENDMATAFSCGYKNGTEFIGILPKQTGDFTIESLDIPSLLASETKDYDVIARMPELRFDSSFPLNNALSAAGLSELFNIETADLSGISDERLCVTEVLQKTRLELDKDGTKAAAVTAIAPGNMMPMPKEKKEVTLDRPFAFMIYDSEEEQIVFLGKVTEP